MSRADREGEQVALEFADVTFTYAGSHASALRDVSLVVPSGAFVLVVGNTGAGKSTLVRLACPALAPAGALEGGVHVFGRPVRELAGKEGTALVGLVMQDVDAQIVCEDVRSEMAFGLEGLGLGNAQMGQRIAEAATFLDMGPWFGRRVAELSGGQRQTLALASTLAMRPRLLLLDEPVAQLDPIAAAAFAALVGRANRELGITVVVVTHAPATFAPFATAAYLMEDGTLTQADVADVMGRDTAFPARVRSAVRRVDVRAADAVVEMRDVWFRHERRGAWVLSGLDVAACAGEVQAVLGGNGSGKTTLLRLASGAIRAQRGRVRNARHASMGYVPQRVKALIGQDSVRDELMAWSRRADYDLDEALALLDRLCLDARELLDRHPLDLSGGQQQLLVLAKVLLARPSLLLLDEPTVGLDAVRSAAVANVLRQVAAEGATVVMATHDVRLARGTADVASLLFDGRLVAGGTADDFFADAWLWGA